MIAISSCLVGENCTYKGSNNYIKGLEELVAQNKAITICPEVLGGMTIPRNPCEIVDQQQGIVIDNQGNDKSKEYLLGAQKALKILQDNFVDIALLKFRSPSCGKGLVYDGSFSHQLVSGDGITTKLLQENGIVVYNENEIDKFFKEIEKRYK